MKIRWSLRAKQDRWSQISYIAERSPVAAIRIGDMIVEATAMLADFPMSGPSGQLSGTRERHVPRTPFRIVYRINGDEILIMRLLHGKRRRI